MSNPAPKRRTGGGWNKKLAVGKKQQFTMEQVQLIRASLRARGDPREMALFEVALTSLLRSVDLLKLSYGLVTSQDRVLTTFYVQQKKTKKPVKITLSDKAIAALEAYLAIRRAKNDVLRPESGLWTKDGKSLKRLRYSQIIKGWAKLAYLDPRFYSTHSMRRTMAAHVFKSTGNIEAVRKLLGHANLSMTGEYLGLEDTEAHDIKKQFEM